MHFSRLLYKLEEKVAVNSIFPCSYRTCTMQKGCLNRCLVWEGAPEDEEAILQVIKKLFQVPPGESISPTPDSIMKRRLQGGKENTQNCISPTPDSIMKRRLQGGKENTQNCSFRMTPISLGPSSNSDINTESLLNKQLHSNQDAIYTKQAASLY